MATVSSPLIQEVTQPRMLHHDPLELEASNGPWEYVDWALGPGAQGAGGLQNGAGGDRWAGALPRMAVGGVVLYEVNKAVWGWGKGGYYRIDVLHGMLHLFDY